MQRVQALCADLIGSKNACEQVSFGSNATAHVFMAVGIRISALSRHVR